MLALRLSFDSRGGFLYTDLMRKKYYIAIAKILNKYSGKDNDHMLWLKLCQYFKEDNPKFNIDKFIDACSQ